MEVAMATNIYNKVTVKDQDFVIKRFDAKTGLKLARLVMAKAEPLVPLLAAQDKPDGIPAGDGAYKAAFAILGELTDSDIDELVNKCLKVCYVDLPGGRVPVMDEAGFYCVDDVEYDIVLTLMLCYEAIKWGAADFFDENSYLSNLFKR